MLRRRATWRSTEAPRAASKLNDPQSEQPKNGSNRSPDAPDGRVDRRGDGFEWLKKVGDQVARDEPLLEISTDKVDAEIPSPAAGTLVEVMVEEGQTVEVGSIVAYIETEAGAAAAPAPAEAAPAPAVEEKPAAAPAAAAPQGEEAAETAEERLVSARRHSCVALRPSTGSIFPRCRAPAMPDV